MTPNKPPKKRVALRDVHHDDGDGNWLVSYADMMTLLFGFFVILTAFSVPDPKAFSKLQEATAKSMNVAYTKPFLDLVNSLQAVLREKRLDKDVSITENPDGVDLTLRGRLFFNSASSKLTPDAQLIMTRIAPILVEQAKSYRIEVAGHTDDVPIRRGFPSNWELSSARASTVLRMLEKLGFPHQQLRAVGLADTEPVAPNRDINGTPIPENRAKNRRIVIHVQRVLAKML